MSKMDRFDAAAARAEMVRIDTEWNAGHASFAAGNIYRKASALLARALDAIDAGWPEPMGSLGTITDAMVEEAAIINFVAVYAPDGKREDWVYREDIERASYRRSTRAVLEYAASLAPAKTTIDPREERLDRFRCAMLAAAVGNYGTTYGQMAQEIEGRAREQLDIADRYDESAAAEKIGELPGWERLRLAGDRIEKLHAGIRAALEEFDEAIPGNSEMADALRVLLLPGEKGPFDHG